MTMPLPAERIPTRPSTLHPALGAASEMDLLERARGGEQAAFGELIARHRPRLVQLVASVLRDASQVDDVVQESCLSAYRAVARFRGDASFFTWLYQIGLNAARRQLRRQRGAPRMVEIDALAPGALDSVKALHDNVLPESQLACSQLADTLLVALAGLPPAWRTTVLLRDIDAMSYADIASTMQCSLGTVRSRIARSHAVLNASLGPLR